jgi:hypothetical protein
MTLSSRPGFQVLIYPGLLGIPDVIPADAPPAFLLVANDDRALPAWSPALVELGSRVL